MTDLRDSRLHEALKAAPDDALRPALKTRESIRAHAHAAVAAPPFYVRGWRQAIAQLGGSGRPWNAAFATLLVAGFVTVLWQGREVPPAAEPAQAVADVAAPVATATPELVVEPAAERATERAPAPVTARKSANVSPPAPSVAKDNAKVPTETLPEQTPQVAREAQEAAAPLAKAQVAEAIAEPVRAPPAPAAAPDPAPAPAAAAAAAPRPAPAPALRAIAPAPAAAAPAAAPARARIADSAAFGAAAPVAKSVWALPRWNRLGLAPSQTATLWDRSQATALADQLERLLAVSPVVQATASASVLTPLWRLELLQDEQSIGVAEVGRDTLRWVPVSPAQDSRTVRPDPTALLALLEALAQLASR